MAAMDLASRPPEIQGVITLSEREIKFQRRAVLALTILPFLGLAFAVMTLWGRGLSGTDLGIALFFYFFSGLGVTVGFHRLLTHRSFDTPTPLRLTFAIAGSLAVQGSVISWVAAHRRHHAYSDREGDPHSPHLEDGEGIGGILKGLWHAHVGWLFDKERTDLERWAPDLMKNAAMRRIDSKFPALVALSLTLPALCGLVLTRSLWGALTAFLWGSLARVFVLHHVTWSINSICHFYGRRPFDTPDHSTNNWVLAIISFGESWHNNHHAFPTAAVHGIKRWQVDLSGMIIGGLERVGLARNVKRVTEKQLERKSL
ncbi:MAG TPA: acyl-CoA desaturase [Actinomycetota bacterium]|nr:acyl-CoA desaturase [Actinomycetota bacterium]